MSRTVGQVAVCAASLAVGLFVGRMYGTLGVIVVIAVAAVVAIAVTIGRRWGR